LQAQSPEFQPQTHQKVKHAEMKTIHENSMQEIRDPKEIST
jgi:hypothetical protein